MLIDSHTAGCSDPALLTIRANDPTLEMPLTPLCQCLLESAIHMSAVFVHHMLNEYRVSPLRQQLLVTEDLIVARRSPSRLLVQI